MDGKGNATPPAGAWSERCLNYISHSALEAQGCLCLRHFLGVKVQGVGWRVSYWRVGSDQKVEQGLWSCRQLWLGLEPLIYFFPAPTSSKV